MLRLAALLLLSGCLLVEANRCRYRELNRAPPLEVTRPRPRICRGAGSFIGDDYWTSIGYDGQIRDGRSRGDFLVFDQISNGYIAYWITRTKYGNVHYEAFGHAFVRPDGRTCAWFVGKEKEIVEVCGGFRILSRSRYNPAEPIPFEWILATPETHSRDTLGFHTHRIGKYSWQGENFYGDARTQDKNFQGVSPASETFVEVTEPFDFERKVWLLRRKADASLTPPEPLRIEQPPPDKAGWRYADPHTQEGLVYQVAQQDPIRPYAPSDSRDPRYYDPRYWFDRRNWKWINGQWSYEPGNFEYYEIDPQYQDPRNQQRRGERPRFYQVPDPRFKNDTVDTWDSQNAPSSQDRLAVPGYPYSDGKAEAATRVVGDNEGWHVVGDNSGTPVGEGAAPAGGIGQGVHPQGQGPLGNNQAAATAPEATDVQIGYYTDHYGRRIPVDRERRPVGEGVAPESAPNIGQGAHPQGQQPASHNQGGEAAPQTSAVQPGYYTDQYGRQVPVGGVRQVGTGTAPQPGLPLNQQEIVSYPNIVQPNAGGQEEQPGQQQHLARLHRPTIVKDEFGTIYHPTVVNGQVHYIPEADQSQIVRPDPRLVSNPRIADLDNAQWRRQQEHMRIAEEERKLQEQAVRDRWANEQVNKGEGKKEDVPQWKPVGRTDEAKPEDVGQHEREQEDPVPFEKDDEEEPAVEQPAKLPTPRENPEDVAEDDEDDS